MSVLQLLSDEIAAVVEKVRPAVVHLRILGRGHGGTGSGFLCGPDGLVVTNHHVVADALAVEATFHDGRTAVVDVLGSDAATDLALLHVAEPGAEPLQFADSAALRVGDFALAVGCPHGLAHSVSAGIISSLGRALPGTGGRTLDDEIQT